MATLLLAVVWGGGTRLGATGAQAASDVADWTMMLYVVADTSGGTPEPMVRNLNQIAATVPATANTHIVALVDMLDRDERGAPTTALRGPGQFTTTKLLVLDDGKWNEIRDLGEQQMGRPDTLSRFIHEAADRFPARKYGLVLRDHGGGYQGGYQDIGPPQTTGLGIPDIRAGIASGLAAAGIPRLDFLYHAACLMSSYETASALAPLAKVMVGSEEVMLSSTQFPDAIMFPQALRLLADNASADRIATTMTDAYGRYLEQLDEGGGASSRALAAMSVIDGDKMRYVDTAVSAFSRAALAHADELAPAIARARGNALEFVVALDPDLGSMDIVDLGDLLKHLDDVPPDVASARNAVYSALRLAVTHKVTGTGTQQATGINVFMPTDPQSVGPWLSDGTVPPAWGQFVSTFLNTATAAADGDPDARFADRSPQVERLRGGVRLTGRLRAGDGAKVVRTRTQVEAQVPGVGTALLLLEPAYLGAGGRDQVQGVWNYAALALRTGQRDLPLSVVLQPQSGGLVGTSIVQYTAPGGGSTQARLQVLLNARNQVTSISAAAINPQGGLEGIGLQNGGTIRPIYYVFGSNGVETRPGPVAARIDDRLTLDFAPLPARTPYQMGLIVSDVGNQKDAVFAQGRTQ